MSETEVRKGSEWVWRELGCWIYFFVVILLWLNASTITIQMHCNMTDAVSLQRWPPSGYHRDVTWRPRGLVQTHLTLNITSCIYHVTFLCPAGKLLNKISHLRVAYVYSSGTILRPSVGIVLAASSCLAQRPSSHENQNSTFVWPSGVNFGTVWRQLNWCVLYVSFYVYYTLASMVWYDDFFVNETCCVNKVGVHTHTNREIIYPFSTCRAAR